MCVRLLSLCTALSLIYLLLVSTSNASELPANGVLNQQLDFQKITRSRKPQPLSVMDLEWSGQKVETELSVSGTQLLRINVADGELISFSASTISSSGITLSVNRLTLNDNGEAVGREELFRDIALGITDREASVPERLYGDGPIYIAINTSQDNIDINFIARKHSTAATFVQESLSRTEPTDVDNNIAGNINGREYCLRPRIFSSGDLLDVDFYLPAGMSGQVQIYDSKGKSRELRYGKTHFQISNLNSANTNVRSLCLKGQGKNGTWRLLVKKSQRSSDTVEPSVMHHAKQRIKVNQDITGVLDSYDEDTYLFAPELINKIIELDFRSGTQVSVCLVKKKQEECFYDSKITIKPIQVVAGLSLKLKENGSDRSSAYRMRLTELTLDETNAVLEPNYRTDWQKIKQTPLRLSGHLNTDKDIDNIMVDLGSTSQLWRFIILGEGVGRMEISNNGQRAGVFSKRQDKAVLAKKRMITPNYYLQPGTATLRISGVQGPYKVIAKPLGPPPEFSEHEPNEHIARKITFDESVKGVVSPSDIDNFAFYLERESDVLLSVNAPAGAKYSGEILSIDGTSEARFTVPTGAFEQRFRLLAGDHLLRLRDSQTSPGEYVLQLGLAKPKNFANNGEVTMSVIEAPAVKSFSPYSQSINVTLKLKNKRNAAVSGQLKAMISNPDVAVGDAAVYLAANEEKVIDLNLNFPNDINAGNIQGFVALVDQNNTAIGDTNFKIESLSTAEVKKPTINPPVPSGLLGGINVALSSLGATLVSTPTAQIDGNGDYKKNVSNAHSLDKMIDGFSRVDSHRNYQAVLRGTFGKGILEPVIKLAGEQAVLIRGVGVATPNGNAEQVKRFAIDVSTDQQSWSTVFEGPHQLRPERQYYIFPSGDVLAKFVRFRALEAENSSAIVSIGELEVIAVPGESSLKNINIAHPGNGGLHCCSQAKLKSLVTLISNTESSALLLKSKKSPTQLNSIITFRNQLPAQVEAVGLKYHFAKVDQSRASLPTSAIVFAATANAAGPFSEVGRFDLPTDIDPQKTYRFDLPERVMARAIKVEFEHVKSSWLQIPNQIKVYEAQEREAYRSVMGLWGEWSTQRYSSELAQLKKSASSQKNTQQLGLDNVSQSGLVQFDRREESWLVTVTGNENTIHITLDGSAGFSPSIKVVNTANETVEPISTKPVIGSSAMLYSYPVAQEGTLKINISEPQRSTVFLFDQSASMDKYLPQIRQSIVEFADGIEPQRDAVRFSALGMTWGTEDWISDPVVLRTALANYPRDKSSNSESALVAAAKELSKREGSRAIVLITDADGEPDSELLATLKSSQVKVFVILVPLNEAFITYEAAIHALALQWAAQSGGEVFPMYRYNDLENGFAKASARLQGLKKYSISAKGEQRVLEPGFLKVSQAANTSTSRGSKDNTLIIFDASGSMLKRLGQQRRITIAKAALKRYVERLSTDNNIGNVGLRTFGGVPDECTTDLRRTISPFNKETLLGDIDSIKARSNAKTAIAASLLAAKDDFSGLEGKKNILLITDGEETCKGNVLKQIKLLKLSGITAKIDVVSFALESNIDRSIFERWAKAGDGIYIDAETEEDLERALEAHQRRRFTLLSQEIEIAKGIIDDEPLQIKAGIYVLKIEGINAFEVEILSGELTEVEK